MTHYEVQAVRWAHGWELHVEGLGVTQVDDLKKAYQQVRDFISTMSDSDDVTSHLNIKIVTTAFDAAAGSSSS